VPAIAVQALGPAWDAVAKALALQLQLPLYEVGQTVAAGGEMALEALLQVGESGLQLQQLGERPPGPVAVNFGSAAMRHRRGSGHNELLGRAVGVNKKPGLSVVDATAGLGRDSFVLADLGCDVTLFERDPIIHALLADGLHRAANSADPWLVSTSARMHLLAGASDEFLERGVPERPAVIYLDPMFPATGKAARAGKEMWLFRGLLGQDSPGLELLALALEKASYRVVVKRPLRAPPLGPQTPGFAFKGKSVRFDVYTGRAV
jgi:16S rRNA (guanine1516-N2)-methyltransferase